MIITNSLGSNYTREDRLLALKLLFQPWKWRNGKDVEKFRDALAASMNVPPSRVQLFLKGRHAILEALKLANVGAGDEVIVQAFTCLAVIQPIVELGAKPIYVDVKKRSLNPSLQSIKATATRETKALILQHTLGFVNSETEEIVQWCKKNHLFLIQDVAHAFGAGGLRNMSGDAFIFSFSQDKVTDGVSGGALIIPSVQSAETHYNVLKHCSYTPVIKTICYSTITLIIRVTYQWKLGKLLHLIVRELDLLPAAIDVSDAGHYAPLSPAPMPNVCAALALSQLKRIDEIAMHRKNIALVYDEMLHRQFKIVTKRDILSGSNLRYPIWVHNRNLLEEKLKKENFYLVDHWYDAPISPPRVDAESLKYNNGSCPHAEKLAECMFNLPTHINISLDKATKLASFINTYAK